MHPETEFLVVCVNDIKPLYGIGFLDFPELKKGKIYEGRFYYKEKQ